MMTGPPPIRVLSRRAAHVSFHHIIGCDRLLPPSPVQYGLLRHEMTGRNSWWMNLAFLDTADDAVNYLGPR